MKAPAPRQLPLPLRLDDDATFANYLTSPANRQLLDHLSGDIHALSRFIWLHAEAGSGRTHLLQALCHQCEDRDLRCVYIPLASHEELQPQILHGLDTMDLVCLDDVDAVAGLPQWESALFNLFNELAETGSRLLVAASRPAARLPWQLADLASRLESGLSFQIIPLSDEDKLQALQLRAQARGFELPPEVASYLLMRNARDMNSLFAVLQGLDEASLEKKRRITIPLLREWLEESR